MTRKLYVSIPYAICSYLIHIRFMSQSKDEGDLEKQLLDVIMNRVHEAIRFMRRTLDGKYLNCKTINAYQIEISR